MFLIALVTSLVCSPSPREDQKSALQKVAAPALPPSAYRSARVLLDRLAAQDRTVNHVALRSLEAKHADASKDHGERVRVTVDLDFLGSSIEDARASAAALAKSLKEEKAVTSVDPVQEIVTSSVSPVRFARIEFDCDPAKIPSGKASTAPVGGGLPDPTSYIYKCATMDRVEVGFFDLETSSRRSSNPAWIEEHFTIRSRDKDRALPRTCITNFAIVLERDHPYTSVTAFTLDPASEECPPDAKPRFRMRLEVTFLRPAWADEVEPAPQKR